MQRIQFFPQATVDKLESGIKKNLAWYRGEEVDAPFDVDAYRQMSVVAEADFSCFDTLNANCTDKDDLSNTHAVCLALKCLSPQQAAEERIWTYATHVLAREYTAKRWNKIPGDDDKAINYIRAHYFVSGARGLIRDNAVSRLWWMGHVASRCRDYDLKETLEILLRDSDVRANLLERASVSMSAEMFSGVIRILGKSRKTNPNSEPAIYKRENFRAFMKTLNRRGGRFMLNALSEQKLNAVLEEIANEVTT